jgi:3-dehydroquinate dehydratase/shikimate dehydrogenase
MIIVSITGPTMQEALAQVGSSARHADMFEFRLDLVSRPNVARLLAATRKPTIATCRPAREGGGFSGSERERIGVLELASVFGAQYVDLELSTSPGIIQEFIRRRKETAVTVSHHILYGVLFDVERIYSALHSTGADVIKLAFECHDAFENHLAFDFLARAKSDKRRAIAIAMGEAGEPSRVLYRKFGGWGTYAATEDGRSAAPGQIRASQLKELYRAHVLTPSTKVYGVVGNPIRQSKGIFLHNPLFRKAGQNAVYCRFKVVSIDAFMSRIVPLLSGFSVTLPHKQEVIRYLHRLDARARAIGAVNTVIRRGGKLFGTNTDAPGALDALEKVAKVKGKRVLILGAGGAARAIAYEAKTRGAMVSMANRTGVRARRMARDIGGTMVEWGSRTDFDILINATSVGMAPHTDQTPIPKSILKKKIVFDAVYNPPVTKLLREAKSVGAKTISGIEMYLNQAALQSELYTGIKPSTQFMRKLM